MPTGYLRNTTTGAKSVRLVAAGNSAVEYRNSEGSKVNLNQENVVANLGANTPEVNKVTGFEATVVIT